ncbi:hypothetical protein HY251_07425 [bacterium]|nr:hypothetical protein [bacterium]
MDQEQTNESRPRARRVRQSKFVPLVLLLLMAAIWGYLNWNLYEPYRGPCAVADEGGVFVFYDRVADKEARPQDRNFYFRKSLDGRKFDKPQRVEGALVSAALDDDGHLICIFHDFFSVYSRAKQLEREWSASTESLGFEGRYLQRRGSDVFCFGTDKQGALRAAKLVKTSAPRAKSDDRTAVSWRFVAIDGAKLEKAAEPPGEVERDESGAVPSPTAWAGAEDASGRLAIFFRVQAPAPEKRGSPFKTEPIPPGRVSFAIFDGSTFASLTKLDEDLPAFAATSVSTATIASGSAADTAAVGTHVLVFGTRRGEREPQKDVDALGPRICCWSLEGTKLS